jgi:YHS domain-containing protein
MPNRPGEKDVVQAKAETMPGAKRSNPAMMPMDRPTTQADPESSPIALALEGFCPVCMIEDGKMVPGKATESLVHQGKRYHFATAEQKQTFLANPKKYLPGADGLCVVTLVEENKAIPGSTKFPALFADKVFFLSDAKKRDKFLKEPEAFVTPKGELRQPKIK